MQIDAVAEHERLLSDLLAGRYPDERGRYGLGTLRRSNKQGHLR